MAYLTETYTNIENRLNDWLQDSGGGSVTDLPLDLLNRAQELLLLELNWDGILKRQTLTVTNKSATIPSDCISIVKIGIDTDNDGKLDEFYYENASLDEGYYVTNSFDKDTGHSKTITFYESPSYSPILIYFAQLEDFTGENTEYSYFPGNLLLRAAQKLRIEEEGLSGPEMSVIINSYRELLNNYKQKHQYNNREMRWNITDWYCNQVVDKSFSLGGGTSYNPHRDNKPNDYIP